MRVHELAKELKLESKELIARLTEMGVAVKSHTSGLTDEQTEAVRTAFRAAGSKEPKKPARKEVSPKAPAEPTPKVSSEIPEEASQGPLIEKRISGTVIRRRKKIEPEPVPEPELPVEPLLAEQETAPAHKEPEIEPEQQQSELHEKNEPQEAVVPEPHKAAETESAQAQPHQPRAPEKVPEERPVRKIKIKEKESTPARVIDRIELFKKKEEDKPPAPPSETVAAPTAQPETDEFAAEKEKKGFFKDKSSRKKFRWQKEVIDEDEQDKESVPYAARRVRYKLKDKPSAKARRQKADVVPFTQRKETEITVPKAIKRKIKVHEGISVGDLSKRMGVKASEVIKKLFALGIMATINQILDTDTAVLVASDFGYEVESVSVAEETIFEERTQDAEEHLQSRYPIVTVMGHVDHGKTTLLDTIRKTNVAEGEKGGITQHIGAYRVSMPNGTITFIDTPGHEAFTTMRARGAQVTDIVILVVAAEEGVKPQTIEAINHAKAAGVPIIVAVNKIDKPDANPEKVRQELSNYGLLSEEWGGETIFVGVSAKKNQGIDKLLEMVLLQSEMLELRANPDKPAKGTIVEARLDRGRGPIATALVQEGTLHVGDSFVSRHNFGKVRALIDDTGSTVQEAGPSTPVEIIGFASVPEAGDKFIAVDEKKARQTSIYWQQKRREGDLKKDVRVSLENFLSTIAEADSKELRIVIKADVQGSVEALKQSLETLSTDEIKVNVIHTSVGSISLNDVMLASASNAIVVGFGVKTEPKVEDTATQEKVDIRIYSIIYDVIDDVKKAMTGMLAPKLIEKTIGKAEVKQAFAISKMGTIAGCFVVEGKIMNGSKARVIRAANVVYDGAITSLKKFKDDAREVLAGQECGIFLDGYEEFQAGDTIESYLVEEVERKL